MGTRENNSGNFCEFYCLQDILFIKLPGLYNYWFNQMNKSIVSVKSLHHRGTCLHKFFSLRMLFCRSIGEISFSGNLETLKFRIFLFYANHVDVSWNHWTSGQSPEIKFRESGNYAKLPSFHLRTHKFTLMNKLLFFVNKRAKSQICVLLFTK